MNAFFFAASRPACPHSRKRRACAPRTILLTIGLVLPALACRPPQPVAAQAPPQPPPTVRTVGEDWLNFLGPRNDGSSAETGVSAALWQPIPELLWRLRLGTSYGAPTIADGCLYQFERIGDVEQVTCYSAETSQQLWKWGAQVRYDDIFGYNNGPRCSPIIDGQHLYLYGVTGRLSCIDRHSGQAVWSRDVNQEYDVVSNFFGVASNPFVYQDLLLVMVGGSTPETRNLPTERLPEVQPNGTAIVAFDKRTGREVYRTGKGLASYSSPIVATIEGEPTGLAFLREGLLAWEPATGKEKFFFPWRASFRDSVNAALPVVVGNRILLSEAYEIGSVLLEVRGGQPQVVWEDGGPRSRCRFRAHWSTPVVVDGYLYGCSGRNSPDTDFRCVRMDDGEVMWTDRNHDRQRSSVLLVDGYLIVLGETGTLELVKPTPERLEVLAAANLSEMLDPKTQASLLRPPCWAAPVLSHGLLYLRGEDSLVCLNLIPQSAP